MVTPIMTSRRRSILQGSSLYQGENWDVSVACGPFGAAVRRQNITAPRSTVVRRSFLDPERFEECITEGASGLRGPVQICNALIKYATRAPLEFDLALNGPLRGRAVGMEIGRAMIALYDRDGSSGYDHRLQNIQRRYRLREVLQDKANEDVVEGFAWIRHIENVSLLKADIL